MTDRIEEYRTEKELHEDLKDIEEFTESVLTPDIAELRDNLLKLKEDIDIWNILDDKIVPYIYEKSLYKIIKNLNEKPLYKNKVNCFKNLNYGKNIKPLTETRYNNTEWRKDNILKCTTYLKNAKEFHNIGKTASIETQPFKKFLITVVCLSMVELARIFEILSVNSSNNALFVGISFVVVIMNPLVLSNLDEGRLLFQLV